MVHLSEIGTSVFFDSYAPFSWTSLFFDSVPFYSRYLRTFPKTRPQPKGLTLEDRLRLTTVCGGYIAGTTSLLRPMPMAAFPNEFSADFWKFSLSLLDQRLCLKFDILRISLVMKGSCAWARWNRALEVLEDRVYIQLFTADFRPNFVRKTSLGCRCKPWATIVLMTEVIVRDETLILLFAINSSRLAREFFRSFHELCSARKNRWLNGIRLQSSYYAQASQTCI